jgi:hypothetical protein
MAEDYVEGVHLVVVIIITHCVVVQARMGSDPIITSTIELF